METPWTPEFDNSGAPLYAQIVAAMRRDRASGILPPGHRLPTQRHLAQRLGIGIGTVTRAYTEAERLGLIVSHVGRGTFMAGAIADRQPEPPSGRIDLSLNVPPFAPAIPRVAAAIAAWATDPDLGALLGILPSAGHKRHRQVLASWASANHGLSDVDWRRLIVTTGGQHALNLALRSLTEPGDTVLIEASTFFGFRTAAEHHRVNLQPVRIDRQGMDPESLEAAIRQTGARVVYLQPTLHNPTTRSMSPARRREIAAIIRQHGLTLIEGDVYGALARHGAQREKLPLPIPIATLIPERTWFISSMGKVVASGLRVGLLIVPDRDATETVNLKMRADCYASSPVGTELIVRMISDGTTIHLIDEIVHQATQRTKLACEALSPWIEKPSYASSLHIWMPMPELDAERLYGCALRNDIILTPPAAFSFGTPGPTGIRLCLNGPASTEHLIKALDVIVSTMRHTPTSRTHSIV